MPLNGVPLNGVATVYIYVMFSLNISVEQLAYRCKIQYIDFIVTTKKSCSKTPFFSDAKVMV